MGDSFRAWRNGVAALLLAPFLVTTAAAADGAPAPIRDFSKGLQTTLDSALIEDGASPDLLNVDVENGSIEKRGGSVAVSTSSLGGYGASVRFLYEYIESDGDRWLISASSATIFKSNNGGQNNSVLTSTHGFTTNSQYCAVTAFGTTRLTDGTTNWITWNGTTVGVSTTAPHGPTCAFLGDRVWTSVGSTLYATNVDDVEDWTVTVSSDDRDAIEQTVRFNDGQGITCLKAFRDRLLVFKAQSLDAYVQQSDGLSYSLEPISNHIGTSHCNSVVEREGDVVFLGPDAFYKYDPGNAAYKGYSGTVSRISDIIKPTVASIQQLDANSTYHIETGESDFSAGTLSQMSATITSGSLVLSTFSVVHTSSADFAAGTLVNMSTSTSVGDLYMNAVSGGLPNPGFEFIGDGYPSCFTNLNSWEGCSGGFTPTPSVAGSYSRTGSYAAFSLIGTHACTDPAFSETYYMNVVSSAGVVLATNTYNITEGAAWTQRSVNLSSYAGQTVKIRFVSSVGHTIETQTAFVVASATVTWYDKPQDIVHSAPTCGKYVTIDDVDGNVVAGISTASFVSAAIDSGMTTPFWGAPSITATTNGSTFTYYLEVSADAVSWDSAVAITHGAEPAVNKKRYGRWSLQISTSASTTASGYLSEFSITARASSGTYQGAHFATSVSSFGTFEATEALDGASSLYVIYTDTNTAATPSNSATWVSSQTVTSGAVPTLTPSSYAFLVATMTISASAQAPAVSELSLALTGGNQSPVWSEYHLGTVLTALSTASASGNDSVLLWDRNAAWTVYDHDWYCMKRLLSGAILAGSNSDGKIYRFRDRSLENDNGAGISWHWRSKDFDFGLPVTDKTMLRYYVTADYAADSDATFAYGVNRGSSTSETLDLDLYSGFSRKIIRPASLTYSKGLQHFFRLSGSGVDQSCVIRSVTMKPRSETEP